MVGQPSEQDTKIQFLEKLVLRLSQELSRQVEKHGEVFDTENISIELPEDVEIPEWLVSPRLLSPLVTSLDSYNAELKVALEQNEDKYSLLKERTETVISENAKLQEKVLELTNQIAAKVDLGSGDIIGTSKENIDKRLNLYEKESDLLRAQNSELSAEVLSLHSELESKGSDLVSIQQQQSSLLEQYRQIQRESNSLKARIIESEQKNEEYLEIIQSKNEAESPASPMVEADVSREGQLHTTSADNIKDTQELEQRCKQLQDEVDKHSNFVSAAQAEISELRKQTMVLKELNASLEDRNTEMQEKSFSQMYTIQELNESLNKERMLHEVCSKSKHDLTKEIEEMNDSRRSEYSDLKARLQEQYYSQISIAESASKRMKDFLASLRNELSAAKAEGEKAKRNAQMYQNQMQEMKTLAKHHPSKVASLLRRLEDAEKEKDIAIQQSLRMSNESETASRENDREIDRLKTEKEKAVELAEFCKIECSELRKKLEETQLAFTQAQKSSQLFEKSKRDQIEGLMQKLKAHKMESSEEMAELQRRLKEEEQSFKHILQSQPKERESDDTLQKYKSDIIRAQHELDHTKEKMKLESSSLNKQIEEIKTEYIKLEGESSKKNKYINILKQENQAIQDCLKEAENEIFLMHEKMKNAVSKEVRLIQEKEVAFSNLERQRMEATKAKRAYTNTAKKVDFLKNQCEALQSALSLSQSNVMQTSLS